MIFNEKRAHWTGFEPAREDPKWFLITRLNHSAISAWNPLYCRLSRIDFIDTNFQRYSAELKQRNNIIYHYPCQVWFLIFIFPFVGLYSLFLSRKVIKYQTMFEWKAKLLTLKLYRTLILGYFMALAVSGLIIGLILCTDCKSLFQQ